MSDLKERLVIEKVAPHPDAPDVEVYLADLTVDGHTKHFQGKSEEQVLEEAEAYLASR